METDPDYYRESEPSYQPHSSPKTPSHHSDAELSYDEEEKPSQSSTPFQLFQNPQDPYLHSFQPHNYSPSAEKFVESSNVEENLEAEYLYEEKSEDNLNMMEENLEKEEEQEDFPRDQKLAEEDPEEDARNSQLEADSQASFQGEPMMYNSTKQVFSEEKVNTQPKVIFNITDAQYDVIKHVGKNIFKWRISHNISDDWDVCWTDKSVPIETLAKMKEYQKINHFPGIHSIARKNNLGKNLMKMNKIFPESYSFFPKTYLLPTDFHDFKSQFLKKTGKKQKTFIIKPEANSQGRGIFLTRTWENINPKDRYVAQKYLAKPYLIDGLKFDLRLYVLLAGCDPLRIYLYKEGLGRFATEQYHSPNSENLADTCMHLTNYAINKENPNFVFNNSSTADDIGHKKSLTAVFKILEEQGHNIQVLWEEIKKIIIKVFCSVQPVLAHYYRTCHSSEPYNNMCFEVLGFDIMLDSNLKPWLIEVNHLPSFATDTPLDESIKRNVIKDAFQIMNISPQSRVEFKNRKKLEMHKRSMTRKTKLSPEERKVLFENAQRERDEWEAYNHGGYEKIFPLDESTEPEEDYAEFMKAASQQWQTWAGNDMPKKQLHKRESSQISQENLPVDSDMSSANRRLTSHYKKLNSSPKYSSSTSSAKRLTLSKTFYGASNESTNNFSVASYKTAVSNSHIRVEDVESREANIGPWDAQRITDESDTSSLYREALRKGDIAIIEEEKETPVTSSTKKPTKSASKKKPKLALPKPEETNNIEDRSIPSSFTQRGDPRGAGPLSLVSPKSLGSLSERGQALQKAALRKKMISPKKLIEKVEKVEKAEKTENGTNNNGLRERKSPGPQSKIPRVLNTDADEPKTPLKRYGGNNGGTVGNYSSVSAFKLPSSSKKTIKRVKSGKRSLSRMISTTTTPAGERERETSGIAASRETRPSSVAPSFKGMKSKSGKKKVKKRSFSKEVSNFETKEMGSSTLKKKIISSKTGLVAPGSKVLSNKTENSERETMEKMGSQSHVRNTSKSSSNVERESVKKGYHRKGDVSIGASREFQKDFLKDFSMTGIDKELSSLNCSKLSPEKPKKLKKKKTKKVKPVTNNTEENYEKHPKRIMVHLEKESFTPTLGISEQELKRSWPAALLKADEYKLLTSNNQNTSLVNVLSPHYYKVKLGKDASPLQLYELRPNQAPKEKRKGEGGKKKDISVHESEVSYSKNSIMLKELGTENISRLPSAHISPKVRKSPKYNNLVK